MRPPLLQPPIYLSGAAPPPIAPAVREACHKARPIAGLVGATALGVTMAYFAPRFFDWALGRWHERGESEYADLEVEP